MNGVNIVYTVELRDKGTYGFAMPESEILETCEENIAGIDAVFQHVRPDGSCDCGTEELHYHPEFNQFTCGTNPVTQSRV